MLESDIIEDILKVLLFLWQRTRGEGKALSSNPEFELISIKNVWDTDHIDFKNYFTALLNNSIMRNQIHILLWEDSAE